jgi:hypothetical protein
VVLKTLGVFVGKECSEEQSGRLDHGGDGSPLLIGYRGQEVYEVVH